MILYIPTARSNMSVGTPNFQETAIRCLGHRKVRVSMSSCSNPNGSHFVYSVMSYTITASPWTCGIAITTSNPKLFVDSSATQASGFCS